MTDAELLQHYIQCKRIIHGAQRSPGHHRLLKLGFIREYPVSSKNLPDHRDCRRPHCAWLLASGVCRDAPPAVGRRSARRPRASLNPLTRIRNSRSLDYQRVLSRIRYRTRHLPFTGRQGALMSRALGISGPSV